jgi:hypothetical protein
MAVKPTQKTDWATDGGALKLDPTSVQQTKGWDTDDGTTNGVPEKPTLQHQNGWQNIVHTWVKYFEEVTDNSVVPIGGLVAVASNYAGAFDSPPGVVTNGLILCNGDPIPAGNAISGNTPNLSDNRFIMGSTTSAGLSSGSNTKDLSHSHTVDSHVHSMQNHTHDIGTHTHTSPGHRHVASSGGGGDDDLYVAMWWESTVGTGRFYIKEHNLFSHNEPISGFFAAPTVQDVSDNSGTINTGIQVSGQTQSTSVTTNANTAYNSGGPSSTNTGTDAPGTDTQLSSTQDILPQYYTAKYYMRVK